MTATKSYASMTLVNFGLVKWYRDVSTAFVFLVVVICSLSSAAWYLGLFENKHASLLVMPHFAVILVLTALSIYILNTKLNTKYYRMLTYLIVAVNISIGFLIISEGSRHDDFNPNSWHSLLRGPALFAENLGQLIPQTSLALVLINLGIIARLFPRINNRKYPPSQILALFALLLTIFGLTGILFKAGHLFHFSDSWIVSGISLLFCSLALILSDTRRGLMNIIVSQTIAGRIARINLLAIFGAPPLLGLLFRSLESLGWYQATAEAAIFAILMMTILMVLTWGITRHLNEVELDRHKAERELHVKMKQVVLLSSVAEAANASADFTRTLLFCLEQIGRNLRWPIGHIFLLKHSEEVLTPSGIWYFDSEETVERARGFRHVSEHFTIDRESLINRVIVSGAPTFIENLADVTDYTRVDAAKSAGLVSVLVIPICVGKDVCGVMEFYATERVLVDRDVMPVLESLGKQLGRVIERRNLDVLKDKMIAVRENVLASVSHDLKNPLAVIAGAIDVLGREQKKSANDTDHLQAKMFALISSSVKKMSRMIDDLLDMAKLESGTLRMITQPENPSDLLQEAYENFALLAKSKSITLEKHCQLYLPKISCDRGRLLQVFSNLINNALKFTPVSGQIDLIAFQEGNYVCFVIEDTGLGILANEIPNLFNRYWQSDKTSSLGTGLGLAIA